MTESFAQMFEQSLASQRIRPGQILNGLVVEVGQDYVIVNLVLMPLWTIVDGTRRGLKWAWIFFVMSLFTSLAMSVAFYLAFMERQLRYNRVPVASRTS